MEALFPVQDDYFDYYDSSSSSQVKALKDLEDFVQHDGPFDGLIAFSHGAVLATAFLMKEAKTEPKKHLLDPTFKVAIFFSTIGAIDPLRLIDEGVQEWVDSSDGPQIYIPTAHIWGKNDITWSKASNEVAIICDSDKRITFVHDGGHEIPGSKDRSALYGTVHAIRRTIDLAMLAQIA
jgi:pimeloyl-ACP methyl ester carboxylesterase